MKNFTTQISIKRAFLLSAIIALSSFSFGQENPWEVKKKENPWGTTETQKKEAEKVSEPEKEVAPKAKGMAIDTTSVVVEIIDRKTGEVIDTVKTIPAKDPLPNETNRTTVSEGNDIYRIERNAEYEYNANLGMGLSILSGFALNIFSIPINTIGVFVPTYQERRQIEDFQETNPKASKKEIQAVKRGIRKKKAKKTAGGTAIGLGMFVTLFAVLTL